MSNLLQFVEHQRRRFGKKKIMYSYKLMGREARDAVVTRHPALLPYNEYEMVSGRENQSLLD